jgi:hypothetical protein
MPAGNLAVTDVASLLLRYAPMNLTGNASLPFGRTVWNRVAGVKT